MTTVLTPQQMMDIQNIIEQQYDAIKAVKAIANLLDVNLLEANKLYTSFKNEKSKQPAHRPNVPHNILLLL